MTHSDLGPGAEFDTIRGLLSEWGPAASGIGDDAAVLDVPPGQRLIISTDATVEDVHFRRKWMSAHDVGARALSAALSDLAAMGATAHAVLVSLVVPTIWREHLRDFAAGLKTTIGSMGVRIVGGNLARGASFSCTLTVVGYSSAPVGRSGASVGDQLYVTGTLGGPAAALASLDRQETPEPWALDRFLHPVARLAEGEWLAEQGAAAMIDISDGLGADARHMSAASGVECAIDPALLPRFPGVAPADALASGEEYELLVALPPARADEVARAFRERFSLPFTRVGTVGDRASSAPSSDVADAPGGRVEFGAGYDHFTR